MCKFQPNTPVFQVVLRNFTAISTLPNAPMSGRNMEGVRLKLVGVEIFGGR